MGAGHGHRLHYHGHSPVHRAPAHLKILALVLFMLTVVATPREWFPAFAVYLAGPARRHRVSRVPFGYLAKRMVVEMPFVLFALLVPFVADRPAGRGARRLASPSRACWPPGDCSPRARSACSPP